MLKQTSLLTDKSTCALESLLSAIDSGAENNTWILLAGGSNSEDVSYRPGDEFENYSNAIIDLIHSGWFDNRTVFIAYKRELARDKGQDQTGYGMEKLNPDYRNRFTFYSVFKTIVRKISVRDLLDAVDEKVIRDLADMLRKRYIRNRKIKAFMNEKGE